MSESQISISSCFDGGNIERVSVTPMTTASAFEVQVRVRDDPFTELEKKNHKQWFYFRASGFNQPDLSHKFVIVNAGECSYSKAWTGYNVCASYDRNDWFRVPTEYDATTGHLHWTMNVTSNQVYFAYFAPYSHERHLDLIAKCSAFASSKCSSVGANATDVKVRSLGDTLDGRSMDLVTIGMCQQLYIFLYSKTYSMNNFETRPSIVFLEIE